MRRVLLALAATAAGGYVLIGLKALPAHRLPGQPGGAVLEGSGGAPSSRPVVLPPGTYQITGELQQTPFGPVQVRLSVANGKITEVTAVATPAFHGRSIEINQVAVPMLRQEVLTAQSAAIDVITGATYSSFAYAASVQSALDKAASGQHD
jgi:uncharacterized protein with FMN-binding domain